MMDVWITVISVDAKDIENHSMFIREEPRSTATYINISMCVCPRYMPNTIMGILVIAEQITMRLSMEDRGAYWATLKILFIAIFFKVSSCKNSSKWDNLIELKQQCNRNRDQEQKRNPDDDPLYLSVSLFVWDIYGMAEKITMRISLEVNESFGDPFPLPLPSARFVSIEYPIPLQKARNALVTPLGLRMPMCGGDHLLYEGSHNHLLKVKKEIA
ncbi:hypothetical protein EVAR_9108_1 [Eumeta japonica]|uniref:Uncharacterized protein n=1 Tax=Eumeta variegata TaxID=151549 RepID=A0A4C1TW40_EUMVA|nr:hypothetical protein EVAR_9108_1 [Eumeta japonica]